MDPERFRSITARYPTLAITVVGDFCLDRYLEIDPARNEVSIETGLPVYNVVNVRSQPGGAGTILNNLAALGIGKIIPVGFAGKDAEGFELCRALEKLPGVDLSRFLRTEKRRTFTYCKPLLVAPGAAPVELSRLDLKNWTMTPASLQKLLGQRLLGAADMCDAIVALDQVTVPETGVITQGLLEALALLADANPDFLVLADSRRGLLNFPLLSLKMNAAELSSITPGRKGPRVDMVKIRETTAYLARRQRRPVVVTCAELGIVGATPEGEAEHVAALPLRGDIDIVGAGDAVTANLASALVAGATLREALEIANAAASIVIHKLGTTGTASVDEIAGLLNRES